MKVGFISHYIALSYVASQRLQMLLWATVAMSIIGFLGTVGATAFFCVPVDRVWFGPLLVLITYRTPLTIS
jgi:hypothetical protein